MATLKDFEEQVQTLIKEEKWADAYKVCNKILSYDNENIKFIKLRKQIEKEVENINRKAIKEELLKIENLIKEEKYADYLKAIAPLQSFVNIYPEIGKKIVKAKKLLDAQYERKRNAVFEEVSKEIKNKADFNEVLPKLNTLYKLGIKQSEVKKLEKKAISDYINKQLKENQGLIRSQRFEDIIIFLLKLKKLDPNNSTVQSLISNTKKNYQSYKIESKKDYIFKTIEEIKTLYIRKKYDLCIVLCERLLDLDENSEIAKTYKTKATIKANKASDRKILEDIFRDYKQFKTTKYYKQKNFIRI